MKANRKSVMAAVVIAAAGSAAVLAAVQQERQPPAPGPGPLTVQPVDRPAKPAQPEGENKLSAAHERLMKLAGRYTALTKFSMEGGEPTESTGEAMFRAMLGGRFLASDETGTEFGAPFQAFKMYGYNTESEKYEGVWSYTGATSLMTLTGTSTDGGQTIAFEGSYDGGKEGRQKFDISVKELDAEHFAVTLIARQDDGSEAAKLETTYTRKAKVAPATPYRPDAK